MNNCPKCGNPLQPGVNSCPICGNIINNNQVENSVSSSIPVNNNPVGNMVNPNELSTQMPSVEQSTPESSPVQVQPTPAPVEQVAPTPVAPTAPVAPTKAPVSNVAVEPTKVAIAPTNTSSPVTPESNQKTPLVKDDKPKPKINKKTLIIVAIIVIVTIAAIALTTSLGGKKNVPQNNSNVAVETTAVTSNGYKFNLPKTWLVAEDSENIVINNEENTVSIKFDHSESSIADINEQVIQKTISSHKEYSDTNISQVKISAKDAYLVNTKVNNMPVQIYFINGGSNLMIGVTIIYQTDDSKSKYEATVTEMIGTLSYADESVKALNTINMYSNIFNIYNSVINYHEPTTETNDSNTPEDNESNSPSEDNQSNNNPSSSIDSSNNQSSNNNIVEYNDKILVDLH